MARQKTTTTTTRQAARTITNLEHHIQEEERQMFPVARSVFSREELQSLAAEMLALRPARV